MKSDENRVSIFREDSAAFMRWGDIEEAEENFLKELAREGGHKDHQTLFKMAELLVEKNNLRLALGYYILAIHADVNNGFYKQRFLDVGGAIEFDHYNSDIEDALLQCLKVPGLDFSGVANLWLTTLRNNPDFALFYTDPRVFEKKFDAAPLFQPFFIEGLKKISIHDAGFEDFIRRLRQWLLMGLSFPQNMPLRANYLRLADAVAAYCLSGEYIIRVTGPEQAKLRDISREPVDALMATVRSCYSPPDAAAGFEPGSALAAILKENEQTSTGAAALARPKEAGLTFTFSPPAPVKEPLEPLTSLRWRSIPAHTLNAKFFFSRRKEKMERTFAGHKPEVLVACCGTGREALVTALYYPKGKITAIDANRTNLAYAAMKSREYNINNIEFRRDDILSLEKNLKCYDIVYSSGSLSRMTDPLKGWKILWDRVKPAGVMKIGLYSKTARRHVFAVREAVKRFNIIDNQESMIDFRTRSPELLLPERLSSLACRQDYYSLSTYRNLLFDPGEHCFTLPEIEEALAKLRLSFSGFDISADILQQYGTRFPDDPSMVSLKKWHQFEQEQPDTFAGMYQFWCRKF